MDRRPPYSLEAERAVLGAVFLAGDHVLRKVEAFVSTEDFYIEAHRFIFKAMVDVRDAGTPIDHVTVGNLLTERNEIDRIGGGIFMADLADGVVTSVNADHYAKIVGSKASVRRMISASQEVVANGFLDPEDSNQYLSESLNTVKSASIPSMSDEGIVKASHNLHEILGALGEDKKGALNVVPTGFRCIDSSCGGLISPLLHVVAGRPGMGKSTFLLNLGIQLARSGRQILYVTLEDSCDMQQRRMLSRFSGVELTKIVRNTMIGDEYDRVLGSTRFLSGLTLSIRDRKSQSVDNIYRAALSQQESEGLDVLLVDHLGRITSKHTDPYKRNSENIRLVSDMTDHLGVPTVLACQLNRSLEQRPLDDRIPRLSDLRGAGEIEEDARWIGFIHRQHVYDRQADPHAVDFVIAKSSHGATGRMKLHGDMPRMTITDVADLNNAYDELGSGNQGEY
jgi:replicative DNA helicase